MKKLLLWLWQLPQNIIGWLLSIGATSYNWFGVNFYSRKKTF